MYFLVILFFCAWPRVSAALKSLRKKEKKSKKSVVLQVKFGLNANNWIMFIVLQA